jgi:hypothetical protein
MKFARFPKFSVLTLLAGVFAMALVGCGGGSNLALTQGNWSVTATSTASASSHNIASNIFYIGGNLTQNGSAVSGTMYVANSGCFDVSTPIAISGTVKDKTVTLTTASFQEQVITVTATGTDPSTLSGTYKVTGSGCDGGDQGTVSALAMPAISGTWNGLVASTGPGITQATLSVALTQAATASADGTFALTGTVTYTNSSCSVSGTITTGSVAGQYIPLIRVTTNEQDESQGSFDYTNSLLDSASAPKNMTGDYDVTSGLCDGNVQSLTLTKQ